MSNKQMKAAPAAAQEDAAPGATDPMNALALRIWEGQSISLSVRERVQRIKAALAQHGYTGDDLASLQLPAQDFKRFL